MRFLVDMPLSPRLAAWLRKQGHDAVHAAESGLSRAADIAVMSRARQESRTIITADLDYPRLLAIAGLSAPSPILFRGGNWSDAETIQRVGEVIQAVTAEEIAGSIVVVDRRRVRRRLPIQEGA